MSNFRIGQLVFIRDKYTPYKPCYAAYLLNTLSRNNLRVYTDYQLYELNTRYRDRSSGLFKLKQDERYTLHKQNGYYFYIDVLNTYFNPRYINFRVFLNKLLQNTFITILGDGVGPFSVYLSKNNNFIIGYEYNPACIPCVLINIKINKIKKNYYQFNRDIYELNYFFTEILISVMPMQTYDLLIIIRNMQYKQYYCILLINKLWINILAKYLYAGYQIILKKDFSKYNFIYLIKFIKIKNNLKK